MKNRPPRVAAIHDLSGFGRCSLTVIIPVLSAMGVQVCPVPTAVLSTHTGGLGQARLRDLTDFTPQALAHYQELELSFECVYSGFLSSALQIDHCLDFIRAYPEALTVVDPVMGDHGKPYKTINADMRRKMSSLASVADLITPNLTEACMLLGEEYIYEPVSSAKAKSLLARLAELGPKQVVITGLNMASDTMSNVGFDRERNAFWAVDCDYVPVSYPGTGDLYAAVLVGGLLSGDSLPMAMDRATKFLELCVKTTYGYGEDSRHGVRLERCISWLCQNNVMGGYRNL